MPYVAFTRRNVLLIATVSIALAAIPLALAAALRHRFLAPAKAELLPGIYVPWSVELYSLYASSIILLLTPMAVALFLNDRYRESIDSELPSFFKGVAEGVRAGLPVVKALETAALACKGVLRSEILSATAKVELGIPLDQALLQLAHKVKLPSLRRAATIIITASQSGGHSAEALDAAATMFGMLRSFENERRAVIAPYAWTVYLALIVFLVMASLISYGFMEPMAKLPGASSIFKFQVSPEQFKVFVFIMSLIEAMLGGLIVSKLRTGRLPSGLIHSLVLCSLVMLYMYLSETFLRWLLP